MARKNSDGWDSPEHNDTPEPNTPPRGYGYDRDPHDTTETLFKRAIRQTRENEAAKEAAQKEREAQDLRESEEACRRLPQIIRAHILNGGGLPHKIFLDSSLTLKLLEPNANGLLSEVGQEFYRALANMDIRKQNVVIQRFEKENSGTDSAVGCITIKNP